MNTIVKIEEIDGELCLPLPDEILTFLKIKVGDVVFTEVKDGKLYLYPKGDATAEE